MTLQLNKTYITLTILLFATEVLIATYFKQGFIRYTLGDYLIVILLYCFFKSFIKENHFNIAIGVLALSFFTEFLQGIHILKLLNLQNNHLIRLVLGSNFELSDLAAYLSGIITVLIIEFKLKNNG